MRIAFYAPLKAPDHPAPSGDRTLARLLLAALERAGEDRGWEVDLASRFRSFDGAGDPERQARLRDVGLRLAERLLRRYRNMAADLRPRLWFTYHLHHKAPDWLGPRVSEGLGVPYVVAEASHAAKQAGGPWRLGYEAAARAIRRADTLLALHRGDVPGLEQVAADPARIVLFPPFLGPPGGGPGDGLGDGPGSDPGGVPVEGRREPGRSGPDDAPAPSPASSALGSSRRTGADVSPGPHEAARPRRGAGPERGAPEADGPRLLCVAMMRGGPKYSSFEVLADALARLGGERWRLVAAGDGPARREVEALFASRLPAGRVTFVGRVEGEALAALYAGSDLFVWPAVGEAMGMAMLEAQGRGLPVVAGGARGVPEVVRDGETGRLVPEGDAETFADAVRTLLRTPEQRRRMGDAARARVAREHSFAAASDRIGAIVEGLIRGCMEHADGSTPGGPPPSRPFPAVPVEDDAPARAQPATPRRAAPPPPQQAGAGAGADAGRKPPA